MLYCYGGCTQWRLLRPPYRCRGCRRSATAIQGETDMGVELATIEDAVRIPSWLDGATASLVRAIVAEVASRHPDLRAAFLFGSVARHEERPLSDAEPSD